MNLEKECRRGYVISVEMKKIWSIQIAMLNKLLEVCKKYHLDIWADSGTLLGAVREKGYIPWDDDIDMVMMRKDYNRLVEVSKNEFLDPYFFQCMFTEKHYHRGHAQLRMKGTTAILPGDINECFDQSIFIDIFILDRVPEDALERSKFVKGLEFRRRLVHLFNNICFPLSRPKTLIKNLCLLLPSLFLKMIHFNIYKCFDDYCARFADKEGKRIYYCGLMTTDIERIYLSTEWYKDTVYMPFEDIRIPVPIGYEKILESEYGADYMIPSKIPTLHGTVVFDTERPYTEVLEDIRKGKISLR